MSTTTERAPSGRPRWALRFSTRILLLQLAAVLLAVVLAAVTHLWLAYERLWTDAEQNALTLARSVAADPALRREVAAISAEAGTPPRSELAAGPVMADAEATRQRSGALFVVVTDEQGLRLAHPDPARLGERVSTAPDIALAGQEVTVRNTGTLGPSVGAKVPVFAPDGVRQPSGTVVGEVSTGFARSSVVDGLRGDALAVTGTAALALAAGTLASLALRRRLADLTLGLEPEDIGTLVQDQEAVLRGIDEGVIGISRTGSVTVVNSAARRLLGDAEDFTGTDWPSAPVPAVLRSLTITGSDGQTRELVVGDRVLVATARAVVHGLRELGWVVMLRDRTELQRLTRQLDAVGALSEALRAQRHEFSNQLHAVAGLLDIGEASQARTYLGNLASSGPLDYPLEQAELLGDPALQAFLGAKGIEAAERGVVLRLGDATLVRHPVAARQDVTTVLGNLVDKAVRAAVDGSPDARGQRWVEVELLDDGPTLHIVVADSGNGIGAIPSQRLFEPGYTTAPVAADDAGLEPAAGHGLGLPLARQLARRRGGDVWVISPGQAGGPGAVFGARVVGRTEP
ncbi:sensor histidine kinase [Sinomonas terrae]|uniref:Sensor-like histidine kinase SenX3 n=1 Tax=Sinomonas terrae TaxID=2908838 RepID=A0ABS9U357_9MICC|nr:sensor histidine kinase [Sinomonas terrae]MCH6471030.1 sensor histidine kinase [Sinomonas terrae]